MRRAVETGIASRLDGRKDKNEKVDNRKAG
jgi:hypothetical protein